MAGLPFVGEGEGDDGFKARDGCGLERSDRPVGEDDDGGADVAAGVSGLTAASTSVDADESAVRVPSALAVAAMSSGGPSNTPSPCSLCFISPSQLHSSTPPPQPRFKPWRYSFKLGLPTRITPPASSFASISLGFSAPGTDSGTGLGSRPSFCRRLVSIAACVWRVMAPYNGGGRGS